MKTLLSLALFIAAVAHAAEFPELGIAPEKYEDGRAGRRAVEWYRHYGDPAWGGDTNYLDRFSVAKPVDGGSAGRPLLVVLHWRGAGCPGKGVDMQTGLADEKDRVFSAPDDFYILSLDDIRNYNVFVNRTHDQYWWGATPSYAGPTVGDVPRLLGKVTPCERRIMDCVEWTVRRYSIDRDRVYLCGNSMGGQATLAIGLAHGEVFAALNANVPATVWYAAARLGIVEADGTPARRPACVGLADPPVCVEWSGVDDVWSRERNVLHEGMERLKWQRILLWGDYGHCGSVRAARLKNDLVERFDWLSVRRNEAYPAFTSASCDDKMPWPLRTWKPHRCWFWGWKGDIDRAEMEVACGAPVCGQVNAFFRWRTKRDDDGGLEMDLWIAGADEIGTRQFQPPEAAIADVTVRRIQSRKIASARKVRWTFGDSSGVAARGEGGDLTVRDLGITRNPLTLRLEVP